MASEGDCLRRRLYWGSFCAFLTLLPYSDSIGGLKSLEPSKEMGVVVGFVTLPNKKEAHVDTGSVVYVIDRTGAQKKNPGIHNSNAKIARTVKYEAIDLLRLERTKTALNGGAR